MAWLWTTCRCWARSCWSAASCWSSWAMAWSSAATSAEATDVSWRAASTWSCSSTRRWDTVAAGPAGCRRCRRRRDGGPPRGVGRRRPPAGGGTGPGTIDGSASLPCPVNGVDPERNTRPRIYRAEGAPDSRPASPGHGGGPEMCPSALPAPAEPSYLHPRGGGGTMARYDDQFMRHTDALAWNMEHDPGLRSTIVGVTWLDARPDLEVLTARLDRATRIAPVPPAPGAPARPVRHAPLGRLRSRPVHPPAADRRPLPPHAAHGRRVRGCRGHDGVRPQPPARGP